jgi:hypothetical protein
MRALMMIAIRDDSRPIPENKAIVTNSLLEFSDAAVDVVGAETRAGFDM